LLTKCPTLSGQVDKILFGGGALVQVDGSRTFQLEKDFVYKLGERNVGILRTGFGRDASSKITVSKFDPVRMHELAHRQWAHQNTWLQAKQNVWNEKGDVYASSPLRDEEARALNPESESTLLRAS
jgi:hypothetical protein